MSGNNIITAFKKISSIDWKIIALVLATKFIVFAFGIFSFLLFNEKNFTGSYWIFGIWNRWDAFSYFRIALYGYPNSGEGKYDIAFFPLYPALIFVFNSLLDNEILSAFLVSGVASVAAGLLLFRLAKLDYAEAAAFSAVWFLFIFPTAYFLHIPYTESLFLALVLGCFLAARKEKWLLAGILGFLACTTRINGLILCAALFFEIFAKWRETRRIDWRWLWLGLIPMGFAAYLLINYIATGSALTFLTYQREHWGKFLQFPWTSLRNQGLYVYYAESFSSKMVGLQELLFAALGFLAIIFGWKYLRPSYRAWMILNLLLFISTSWIQSVPRYMLTMFPIFMLFGLLSKRQMLFNFISLWSILFLAAFIIAFVIGQWTF